MNVSGATVSRVLSGRRDIPIAPETRARVLEAAQKIGYLPNAAARTLSGMPTGLVGFWTSLQFSRYRSQTLDSVRRLVRRSEMALAVSDVDEAYGRDHRFTRALRIPVDGILAFDLSVALETFVAQRRRIAPSIPFVSMGSYWSDRLSFVGVDLRAGGDLAMRHLLESGRRRVAYLVTAGSGLEASGPRFAAYGEAMASHGLPPRTILSHGEDVPGVAAALADLGDADALLCLNDEMALSAAAVLRSRGIRPGADVAVVGFDGLWETEHAPCPITTVRQPTEAMAALAFEFLKAQIDDPTAPLRQRMLLPELVVRESSRP